MRDCDLALFDIGEPGDESRMSYSSITITAPDTAEQGSVIPVAAQVTNTTANNYPFRVKIYAVRDIYAVPSPSELIGSFEQAIESGETKHYDRVFTMPAWDTVITVMVYVFDNNIWDFDTHVTKEVILGAAPPAAYADITEIIAPAGANFGDTVNVEVKARNLHTYDITISVTGSVPGTVLSFSPDSAKVPPGGIHSYSASFIMPNNNVTINVWSFYWGTDDEWHKDDEGTKVVALSAMVVRIIRKELEYSGSSDGGVPVSNVPIDLNARLHVWGKNHMSTSQGMGIIWVITGPSGQIVERYEDWGGTIGAGQDHEFISRYQFLLSEAGTYRVSIELSVGEENSSVVVDTWEGVLCTVAAAGVGEDFVLIRDHTYALASTYYGQAERSTVTFSVIAPSFLLSEEKIAEMVTSFEDKFAEEGAHMLSLKLYEKSGLVQTDYSADIVTTIPTAAATGSTVPAIFGISTTLFYTILIAVCLIVGLIIILVVRSNVNQFLFGTPPSNGDPGTPGAVDLIGSMVMMMIMMMMMEQMAPLMAAEGAPPQPKPVTEATVRAAKVAGKAIVKAAPVVGKAAVKAIPYVGRGIKKVTEYF